MGPKTANLPSLRHLRHFWRGTSGTYDDRPKISVSGDATVYATPDKIVVRLGVETQDKNMLVAKQKSNDILKKVFAVLKACGVKESDIQTEYLYAEPRWASAPPAPPIAYQTPPDQPSAPVYPPARQDPEASRPFLGYFVKNVIAVTVKDAAKIDKLIADVLAAGATDIYGVEFQTSELKAYREKARELALRAAKEKAVKMAAILGQSVGLPIEISEWSGASAFSSNIDVPYASPSLSEATTTLALGKIAVRATVSVVFELKR